MNWETFEAFIYCFTVFSMGAVGPVLLLAVWEMRQCVRAERTLAEKRLRRYAQNATDPAFDALCVGCGDSWPYGEHPPKHAFCPACLTAKAEFDRDGYESAL